jgi:two-component system sensor kinase FixL
MAKDHLPPRAASDSSQFSALAGDAVGVTAAEIRLLAARQLVSSIAHEISQPLSSIVNFSRACLNLLQEQSPDLGLLREWNEEIGQASMRAAEMVLNMRRLLGNSRSGRQRVGLGELVTEALGLVAPGTRPCPIEVQRRECSVDSMVEVDRGQILQVVAHLLRTTCEAIERRHDAPRQLTLGTSVEGRQIEIVIVPEASEVPAADLAREATASAEAGASGGCLAICKMIVEAHGGSLSCASLRRGVAFLLKLPLVSANAG